MDNLNSQPFFQSMKMATEQTGFTDGFKTLLQEQQNEFNDYLQACCHPGVPVPERYEFLQIADYAVCSIRLKYADKMRKHDFEFYHFWSILLADTRRFISIGLKSLDFQTRCPLHLLTTPTKTFPEYKWIGSRADLTEALAGVFHVDVIRLKDGRRLELVPFAQFIGSFFGITYENPHEDVRRVLRRKKHQTPFFHRVVERLKEKSDEVFM
jgi:hypothetical protein